MKEFKKWIKELAQQHPMLYPRRFFAEMAWKAALEWVMKEIHKCDYPQDILDMISEELEGE